MSNYQDEQIESREDVEGFSATVFNFDQWQCPLPAAELNARYSAGVHFALPISGDATLIEVGR